MTDNQVANLKAGDRIEETCFGNGRRFVWISQEVKTVGENYRSGHKFAYVRASGGALDDVSFSVRSDEFSEHEGYPVFNNEGNRVRGFEFLGKYGR